MQQQQQIPCAVFGGSGYSGIELVWLLHHHPRFNLTHIFSSGTRDAEHICQLYPQLQGRFDGVLQPWHPDLLDQLGQQVRVCFLALPHAVSAELAPQLMALGMTVFDLSGAFRIQDNAVHNDAYGFVRQIDISRVPYGLAEYTHLSGTEALVAVPGCYPTVASLALKPVMPFKASASVPIINAVSGVSGAGRKAALNTSFCEVSLQAYGIGQHRHQPEIAQAVGHEVVFVPHLGAFKRGILATIYLVLADGVTAESIATAYEQAYADADLVRLTAAPASIQQVAGTPYCDIHWVIDGNMLIITAAIDNLLKGAAAQALQLANMHQGLPPQLGLPGPGAVV